MLLSSKRMDKKTVDPLLNGAGAFVRETSAWILEKMFPSDNSQAVELVAETG